MWSLYSYDGAYRDAGRYTSITSLAKRGNAFNIKYCLLTAERQASSTLEDVYMSYMSNVLLADSDPQQTAVSRSADLIMLLNLTFVCVFF